MTTTTNDTFCINPFLHLLVETDGRMSFCCMASRTAADQNINTHEVDDAWQDPVRNSVIDSINKGERNPACQRCWHTEDIGAISHRYGVNNRYLLNQGNFKKFLPMITPGETFLDIEIHHTNICNLKCGMCFEKNSHSLAAENRQLGISNDQTIYNWDIKKTSDKICNTKWLTIRGGEPLINRELREEVELWIDQGLLDNTTLCIVTNATKIDLWWDTLNRVPNLQFMVSVDGYGEIYNYLRFPGNWDTTSANILKLQSIAPVVIHSVVQNMNIFNLYKLIEWAETNTIPVNLDPIAIPKIYNTTNLPQGLLDSGLEKLKSIDIRNKITRDQVSGIVKYIETHPSKMDLWEDFWHMTYMRQSIRKNNILDAFPEISNYERPRV
jgi:molybdenum cofactor biosynthesis enzyme MoaA